MQINGPGSPSVLTNMLNGIEQHDEYVRNVIVKADKEGIRSIDATPEGQAEWQDRVSSYGESTIFGSCNSWYLGSNVSGKRRVIV